IGRRKRRGARRVPARRRRRARSGLGARGRLARGRVAARLGLAAPERRRSPHARRARARRRRPHGHGVAGGARGRRADRAGARGARALAPRSAARRGALHAACRRAVRRRAPHEAGPRPRVLALRHAARAPSGAPGARADPFVLGDGIRLPAERYGSAAAARGARAPAQRSGDLRSELACLPRPTTIARICPRRGSSMNRPTRFLRTLPALLVLVASSGAEAQVVRPESVGLSSERLERIGELMDRHIEAGSFSGAVTLVARNGRIAHLEAHGLMDIEAQTPMRTDAIFRLASMTKPIAATAVLMLVEEGKIKLTDPVSTFLPSFADPQVGVVREGGAGAGGSGGPPREFDAVPAGRPGTIVDLLTHTSGVMSGRVGNAESQQYAARRNDIGVSYVDELGKVPLDFQPGSFWSYSAVGGFDVLVRVVEV